MIIPRTLCTIHKDVAHLMQALGHMMTRHLGTPSHTSWTLDDGHMSSDIADMVRLAIRWARSPHFG
jgi:hypothetical protein